MSLNLYAFLNLLTYFIALFAPAVFGTLLPINQQGLIVLTIVFYVIGAALMIFYYPSLKDKLVVEKKQSLTKNSKAILEGIIGIGILFAVQMAANYIEISLSGALPTSENTQGIMTLIQENVAFVLLVSIAGPIMEELFFRRALIGFLGNHFNFWIGAVASSFLFYLAHQDGHFILYFSMGMTLALLYRSTGKILTSIVAHCGMNTLVIVANLVLLPLLNQG